MLRGGNTVGMRKEGKKRYNEGVQFLFSFTSISLKDKESALTHNYDQEMITDRHVVAQN